MKVLIIEDDQGLRQGIAFSLAQEGYEVLQAQNGKEGYRLFLQEAPQGILLDLNLTDMDGNDLCRKIRESSQVPILMLTARDMETDEIMGLSSKLRLEKLLGRKGEKAKSHILSSGDIVMDTDLIKVWKAQQEMECSVTEFKILKYFLENKNQVLTQNQILEAVWDREGKFVNPNTLQVNIGRLRKKIEEDPSRPRFIKTIHGIGYIWEERL